MDDCTLVSFSLGPRFPYLCSVANLYPSIFPDLFRIMIILLQALRWQHTQGRYLVLYRVTPERPVKRYARHLSRINIPRRSISNRNFIAANIIRYTVQNSIPELCYGTARKRGEPNLRVQNSTEAWGDMTAQDKSGWICGGTVTARFK
jgi:hypothetical protein